MKSAEWAIHINRIGEEIGGARHIVSLDPDELVSMAQTTTGLFDFAGTSWKATFSDYINPFISNEKFHVMGRFWIKVNTLRALQNRLVVANEIKNRKIKNIEIRNPVFVIGLPRSGTSILYELLSRDDRFRAPLLWEANRPVEVRINGLGRKEITKSISSLEADIEPMIDAMYDTKWDLPAECNQLMNTSIRPFYNYYGSYGDWIDKQKISNSYFWHNKVLQILQSDERIWLLKCPFHIHSMDQVFDVYPDARVIHIHRDPAKSMTSLTKIYTHHLRTLTYSSDFIDIDRESDLWSRGLAKMEREKSTGEIPCDRFIDVSFNDLLRDAKSVVNNIYESLGIEFLEKNKKAIDIYIAKKPRYFKFHYNYDPENYGSTYEAIRSKFSEYINLKKDFLF